MWNPMPKLCLLLAGKKKSPDKGSAVKEVIGGWNFVLGLLPVFL